MSAERARGRALLCTRRRRYFGSAVATCTILADLRRGLLSDETPRKIMPRGKLFLSLVLVAAIIITAFVAYKTIDLPALASTAQECKEQYPMTVMLATIGFATVWSLLLPTTPIELMMGYLFGIAQGWALAPRLGQMAAPAPRPAPSSCKFVLQQRYMKIKIESWNVRICRACER